MKCKPTKKIISRLYVSAFVTDENNVQLQGFIWEYSDSGISICVNFIKRQKSVNLFVESIPISDLNLNIKNGGFEIHKLYFLNVAFNLVLFIFKNCQTRDGVLCMTRNQYRATACKFSHAG
jgi:hypothetical protein